MNQKHLEEPWRTRSGNWIEDKDGKAFCEVSATSISVEMEMATAERIVACVNFCAGAPTMMLRDNPGALMKSFKPLANGEVLEVLTLAVEHERVKADNRTKQETIDRLADEVNKLRLEVATQKLILETFRRQTDDLAAQRERSKTIVEYPS